MLDFLPDLSNAGLITIATSMIAILCGVIDIVSRIKVASEGQSKRQRSQSLNELYMPLHQLIYTYITRAKNTYSVNECSPRLLEEIRRILQENYILLPPALCKAYRLLQDKDDFADTGWEEFCLFIDAEYNFLRKKCNYPYEGNPMPWNLLSCSEKGIYMLSRLVLYFEVAIAFAAFVVMIKHYCVVFSGNGTNTALLLETLLVIVLYLLIIGIIYYHDRYLLHPFKCRLKRELNKKDIKNDDSREDELIKGCEVHNEDVGS